MVRQIAGAKCTWSVKGASRLVGFGPGEKAHHPQVINIKGREERGATMAQVNAI